MLSRGFSSELLCLSAGLITPQHTHPLRPHLVLLRVELFSSRAAPSTNLHGEVGGDAANLDIYRSSVAVPCILLNLLEVAGGYPALIVTLILIFLFLSTGPILRALVLLSGLRTNRDSLSFLVGR